MERTTVPLEQVLRKNAWHFQPFSEESRNAERTLESSPYPLVPLNEIVEKAVRGFPQVGSFDFDLSASGVPLLSVRNISSGDIVIDDNTKFITEEEHAKLKRSAVQRDDVLVGLFVHRSSSLAIVYNMDEPANLSSHLTLLRLNKDKVDPQYLAAFLNSSLGRSLIFEITTGSVQRSLNNSQLLDLSIPLPPLSEQKKLVEAIRTKQERAAQREREADLLREEASEQIDAFMRGEEL